MYANSVDIKKYPEGINCYYGMGLRQLTVHLRTTLSSCQPEIGS
nr:MAG TPA: hypothetical protein [Caudoviricetes sp.]